MSYREYGAKDRKIGKNDEGCSVMKRVKEIERGVIEWER